MFPYYYYYYYFSKSSIVASIFFKCFPPSSHFLFFRLREMTRWIIVSCLLKKRGSSHQKRKKESPTKEKQQEKLDKIQQAATHFIPDRYIDKSRNVSGRWSWRRPPPLPKISIKARKTFHGVSHIIRCFFVYLKTVVDVSALTRNSFPSRGWPNREKIIERP